MANIYKTFWKNKLCDVTYPKGVKQRGDIGDASITHSLTTLLSSSHLFSHMHNFYAKSTYKV